MSGILFFIFASCELLTSLTRDGKQKDVIPVEFPIQSI